MEKNILKNCALCPHNCNIDRTKGKIGKKKKKDTVKIALYSVHDFEEPAISGEKRFRDGIFFKLQS